MMKKSFSSVQFSSVAQSCPTLCNPIDCSMRGLHVPHHLSEFAQTHVHWVSDAIQPPHPLSPPSPPAFSLSQHQGLIQWVSFLHQVAEVLEFQFQHQSFQWIFGLISFRIDWYDLLAIQGILKSLLQHHNSEASILVHAVPQMAHLARLLPHYLFILGLESHCFWGPVPSKAPSFPQVEPIRLSSTPPLITFALICIWFVSL